MQDEYLKPYEPAARIYCAKAGIDPDMQIPTGDKSAIIGAGPKTIPQWTLVAEDLLELSLMLTALREAARQPTQVNGAHHA